MSEIRNKSFTSALAAMANIPRILVCSLTKHHKVGSCQLMCRRFTYMPETGMCKYLVSEEKHDTYF